jgi:hypothetical protein
MTTTKKISIIVVFVVTIALATAAFAAVGDGTDPQTGGDPLAPTPAAHAGSTTTTAADAYAGDSGDDGRSTSGSSSRTRRSSSTSTRPDRSMARETLAGVGGPPATSPTDPIGDLDDDRPIPAGLDFTAPPPEQGATNSLGGPGSLAVAPSCSHQCITKGVAYPRGFGAEILIETSVPAKLFMTAIADVDGDGDYEETHVESTSFGLTSHSWLLDHLAPGQTYHVMAAATDQHDHTAYVWGEFTTLSQRTVHVELGSADIIGGPGNVTSTRWFLGLDGPYANVTPGNQGILIYHDMARYADVDFLMTRGWDAKLCEAWTPSEHSQQGHDGGACVAWNSTHLDGVDLDVVPAGKSRFTQTSVELSLHPPTGAGDALPPGYGDPYYFHFEVPMVLHVTYS